jgi:alpha-tubulin suppressor-like RCC1 family protein
LLALRSDGAVIGWGDNSEGQVNIPVEASSGIVAVSAGFWHSLALTAAGRVIGWCVALRAGVEGARRYACAPWLPCAAAAVDSPCLPPKMSPSRHRRGANGEGQVNIPSEAQTGVIAISAGRFHSLALTSGGRVIGWGGNWKGEATVPAAAQSGIIAIAAGAHLTAVLTSAGQVLAWGYPDERVQLPPSTSSNITAISSRFCSGLALTSSGAVISWGSYPQAQVPAAALSGVVSIADGHNHALAIKADGSVVQWGSAPAPLPASVASGVVAVDAGKTVSLALILAAH